MDERGWRDERKKESNKTEMRSPRPTNVLRSSQSKDEPSGGPKIKAEECVLYSICHLNIFFKHHSGEQKDFV